MMHSQGAVKTEEQIKLLTRQKKTEGKQDIAQALKESMV